MNPARWLLAAALCLSLGTGMQSTADAAPPSNAAWTALTPAQRQALAPLERDWGSIDEPRRAKWLEVASQFPAMPPEERVRVQARMAEWTHMTPVERSRARLQFQQARQLPTNERYDQWQAYQSLPEAERRALAQRAKPTQKAASAVASAKQPASSVQVDSGKRNVVQSTPLARSRAVSPTTQQAKPGATTTTMTTQASPPVHHQAGMPKIAATPGFVDPSTLLPTRGPQGAAVRSAAAASGPAAQP